MPVTLGFTVPDLCIEPELIIIIDGAYIELFEDCSPLRGASAGAVGTCGEVAVRAQSRQRAACDEILVMISPRQERRMWESSLSSVTAFQTLQTKFDFSDNWQKVRAVRKKTHTIFLHLTPPHLAPRMCDQTAHLLPSEGS